MSWPVMCWTDDDAKRWVVSYHKKAKRFPTAISGEISDAGGLKWGTIDTALRKRGSSLSKFIDEITGRRSWTEDDLKRWIAEYHSANHVYPCHQAGEIHGTFGLTWSQVNLRLHRNGSTLHRFIEEQFKGRKPDYSRGARRFFGSCRNTDL